MNKTHQKIGIIGLGAVGKSIITFLKKYYPLTTLFLTDKRELSSNEKDFLQIHNVSFVSYEHLAAFLTLQDYIFISPGIDRTPFKHVDYKWLEEVDFFFKHVKKPVIAVTGSAGKTTTVLLLEHILKKHNKNARACGNVGYPLLSALEEQETIDYFIAELSSFQLEFVTECTPDYSLISNIADNHLDRHKTKENYKNAKGNIFKHQKPGQIICLPFELYSEFAQELENHKVILFSSTDNNYNITYKLSDITCIANWNGICTILELMNLLPSSEILEEYCQDFKLEHRVEFVRHYKNMRFYNDSKSTLPFSTLNALSYFKNENVILLVGGFSKGVNRKDFIKDLPSEVKHIVCFGLESQELASYCNEYNYSCSTALTIKEAFEQAISYTDKSVVILFSPAGSTHTHEFANYKERGNYFKSLALSL